ncbi:MAG: STAS domain-containing protein [Candidatus Omnitrophica bacterium]|nr:STAS domain-containing protein [Candidatus Omnitrophota bacterium]
MIPVERVDQGDVTLLKIDGELDFENTVWLRGELHDLRDQERCKVILDLSGVDIISSYTVGVFVAFSRDLRERGGDLKFIQLQRRVRQTFEATRINQILEIYDDQQTAINAFK